MSCNQPSTSRPCYGAPINSMLIKGTSINSVPINRVLINSMRNKVAVEGSVSMDREDDNTRVGRSHCTAMLVRWASASTLTLVLASCGLFGSVTREGPTVYAPDPVIQLDPTWPQVNWQLSISRPEAPRVIDSLRIAVRPSPEQLQVYSSANWAKMPGEQLESTVLRALEDSGKILGVGRQGTGIAANYKLMMDVRRYESDYAGNAIPTATIEVTAKLLHAPRNDVAAARTFLNKVPATSTDMPAVNQAFAQALGKISTDIAGWALTSGEAHERVDHR